MAEILWNWVLLRKSSGKVQALPLLGCTCLKYSPTVFTLPEKGKKAKPGQQWVCDKAGKKQLWLPPSGPGRREKGPPWPQHTKPMVALQSRRQPGRGGLAELSRGRDDQGIGRDSLTVIYCQALFPNVLIKLQPNKCTSLRSCLCSSTAKTIEYYFQVKLEWDSRQYFYHN